MKHHDQSQKYEISTAARSLCDALVSLRSADEAKAFLDDLCTPAEFEAMIDRWRVAQLLDQGKPYREISELTEVSVTTIGRVARFMELGTGGYRTVLDRMKGKAQEGQTQEGKTL
jgi:TrpR-related protein YerC/YecD